MGGGRQETVPSQSQTQDSSKGYGDASSPGAFGQGLPEVMGQVEAALDPDNPKWWRCLSTT